MQHLCVPASIGHLLLALFLLAANGCASRAQLVEIAPTETESLLANPGMGWQTFHRFADNDETLAGLPSTSAYFRLYWSQVEPEEGRIDFPKLDALLTSAQRAGQKLGLRIMCAGTDEEPLHVPAWLRDKGCPGFEFQYQGSGTRHWIPDMDQPAFLDAHLRLIAALGVRYDGHPDLDFVDIGSVGLWGERHMSDTGVDLPRRATRLRLVDAWCRAFPRTPKVMLIADAEALRHAVTQGCGWRADCLGDFSANWNHMENFYPQQIAKTDAEDAWKWAPIAFESCWDIRTWKQRGWDVERSFAYALEQHASYLNNKSTPLPEGTRPQVEQLLRRLGYRLVLRRLAHPATVARGATLRLAMRWETTGVAPPYGDYRLAFRLEPAAGGAPFVTVTPTSVLGWLPGTSEIEAAVAVPESLAAGPYALSVTLVEPASNAPALRLGIAGRAADGWYPLSQVRLR